MPLKRRYISKELGALERSKDFEGTECLGNVKTCRRNMVPPKGRNISKEIGASETSKNFEGVCCLRNVENNSSDNTALHFRRPEHLTTCLFFSEIETYAFSLLCGKNIFGCSSQRWSEMRTDTLKCEASVACHYKQQNKYSPFGFNSTDIRAQLSTRM